MGNGRQERNQERTESRDEGNVAFVALEAKKFSEWLLKLLAWIILLGILIKQTDGQIVWESAGGVAVAAFIGYVVFSVGTKAMEYEKILEHWDALYLRRFARRIMKWRRFRRYSSRRPLLWEDIIVAVIMIVSVGTLVAPLLLWSIPFGAEVFLETLIAVITGTDSG